MDLLKEEKYSLCQACLSKDRATSPLDDHLSLFLQLLGVPYQNAYGVTRELLLCWECTARLKSIKTFQYRIRKAQDTLQQYIYELTETPQSLSALCSQWTDHYDHSIQNNLLDISPDSYDGCPAEIKLETLVEGKPLPVIFDNEFEDCFDDNKLEDFNDQSDNQLIDNDNQLIDNDNQLIDNDNQLIDNDNQLIDNDNQLIDNDTQLIDYHHKSKLKRKSKKEKTIRKIRNQISTRKYEKYAVIEKKLNIEGEDLKKWYSRLKLTEKEMEEVLNKDRSSKATWKFEKKCKECKIVYRRSVDLKRHHALRHLKATDSLKCAQCRVRCHSLSELRRHWLSTHTYIYRCKACDTTCREATVMGRHVNNEHGAEYTCCECGVMRSTLRSFSEHYKECHEKVICDHCNRSFHKKTTLIKHIKYKHTTPVCDVCNRVLQNHKALTKHRYIVHAITVRGPQPRDLAYCVECDKQFPTIYKYKYHLSQSPKHQNKMKFMKACPECGKVFSRTACMNHHYKLVHLKDTRYQCDICKKCFAMNSRLKQHQRVVHQKIGLPKNKMCDICGRGFTTNRILTEHRRTHTGERPYKCSYCDCAFAQKGAMLVHQGTQHKNIVQNQ